MEEEKRECLALLENLLGAYGFSHLITLGLRCLLWNPYESLLIVDENGKIEFMDRGSEKFFGLPQGGAKGRIVTELFPDCEIPRVLETGMPSIGRVFDVNNHPRIGSSYPLTKDGKIVGVMGRLIFRPLDEVNRINREVNRLKQEVKVLREEQRNQSRAIYTFQDIFGESKALKEAIEIARKVSITGADVLIIGESGTGKELLAHAIHNFCDPQKPFVRVNSSAIPLELVESELFGYEKGTFTGADPVGKPGKFEIANNGTFFLDEVSSLLLSTQAKLLRVLQEKEVERLGSSRIQKVAFRLITATNTDLRILVKENKFREDLYFRVAKTIIQIPPLRKRKEDIPMYIDHFLRKTNERFGTKFMKLSAEALFCLMNYEWPGNVRELINVLEQTCLKAWEGDEIHVGNLPSELAASSKGISPVPGTFKNGVEEEEKKLILSSLEQTRGNKRRAAILLGMPRSSLYKKLKEYGIV